MKPVYVALLSAAAALPLGLYMTYTEIGSPAGDTVTGTPPAPVAAAAAFQRIPAEKADRLPTPADGNVSADEMNRDIAALKEKGGYLRTAVSALQQQAPAQEPALAVAFLRAEIAAIWQQIRAQERRPAMAGGGEEDPAKNRRTNPLGRAEAERRRQVQMMAVEATFGQEPADPQWSSQATLVVQEALTGSATEQIAVQAVECRSHTCRVEISANGTGALAQFIPMFAQQVAPTLPSITANQVEGDSGATTLILYLSRNPDELPQDGG